MTDLGTLREESAKAIASAANSGELRGLEIKYLGRKGELTEFLRALKDLPIEERKKMGERANELKSELEQLFAAKFRTLKKHELSEKLASEEID
ncbi:MAG: phenylalanine--tRNA ligase subunit alpha, partial [Patescibacteria group bacterium]